MIEIPKETKILIIEGVAGAGKTTLKEILKKYYQDRNIFEFLEEETLLGWKHIHIPHIANLRLDYCNLFLDYIEKKLKEEQNPLFIFERFHLSIKILEWEFENNFLKRYEALLNRLNQLPVFLIIVELEETIIKERMFHRERSKQWDNFIEEKLKLRSCENLEQLSIEQQNGFLNMAKEQKTPFTAVKVDKKDIIQNFSQLKTLA